MRSSPSERSLRNASTAQIFQTVGLCGAALKHTGGNPVCPSYPEALESDLAYLQGPASETPLEREGVADAKRDSTIHPTQIAILLVHK